MTRSPTSLHSNWLGGIEYYLGCPSPVRGCAKIDQDGFAGVPPFLSLEGWGFYLFFRRSEFVGDFSVGIEELNDRFAVGVDAHGQARVASRVFQLQRRGFVRGATEVDAIRIAGVGREKFLPLRVLLVFGQLVDAQALVVGLLNGVVAAFADANRGEFVLILAAGIDGENLVLLVLIEAQGAVILDGAVFHLQAAENQAAHFRPFIVHEDHPRGFAAVRARVFLAAHVRARERFAVRNDQPRSAVGLDEIDAMHGKYVEGLIARRCKATKQGYGKRRRDHRGINDQETRVREYFHVMATPPR